MTNSSILHLIVGDCNPEGSVKIIAEDNLCYQVLSSNHGAQGIRTISKKLLEEYVGFIKKYPNATSQQAREDLCGKSDIDKFEYGYTATLLALAKINEDKYLQEYVRFKSLLEYFCVHLQYIVTQDTSLKGYAKYLKPYVDSNTFKKSGQGWKGDGIQKQIKEWEQYDVGHICINVYGSSFKGYATYLHWEGTGLNISANWTGDAIDSIQCVKYNENSLPKWETLNPKFTLSELGLYDGNDPNQNLRALYDAFVRLLQSSKVSENTSLSSIQIIYYGAPGTGKSKTIKREVEDKGMIHFRTTFHPDSDYSTFVGCYKPTMVEEAPVRDGSGHEVNSATDNEKKRISYSFIPQAFTKAYCEAWNNFADEDKEPVFLIIEEINRGNCAQIFGDIFQLLDRKDDGYSDYPIDADEDLKKFMLTGTKEDGSQWLVNKDGIKDGKLCLPPNLHIWATMNTSDQSLFPIDSAFKRRWEWKYMPISNAGKNWKISVNDNEYDWWSFLEKINGKIWDATHSEDKKLGYFFCKADGNNVISAEKFVGKVLFYIYNDVFKDYGFDDKIFKDTSDGTQLLFQSYFKSDGMPNENKVEAFLKNLEVESVSTTDAQ